MQRPFDCRTGQAELSTHRRIFAMPRYASSGSSDALAMDRTVDVASITSISTGGTP
jgi:hypothetical protein